MNINNIFANCKPRLSESPIHFEKDGRLYWRGLDGEIFRKDYNSDIDDFEVFYLGIGNIGCILQQEDYLLLFGDDGGVWHWLPNEKPILLRRYPLSLFNDCVADPKGRIFCGILAENYFNAEKRGEYSYFVSIDTDGKMHIIEKLSATTPNGIRFSPQNDKLYFAVTDINCVFVYDYNADNGKVCNKRVFATDCCPDGITVDNKGNLWVTDCRPGGPLICYSHSGEIIEKYYFPVRRITSVGFGGKEKNRLFITTAHEGAPVGDYDGGVFMLENIAEASAEYFGKVNW